MSFDQMVREVVQKSRINEHESKQALILLVEVLASQLAEKDRINLAARLPEKLADIALSVFPAHSKLQFNILAQFMYYLNLSKLEALQQIQAAWMTITGEIGQAESSQLKSKLSRQTAYTLSQSQTLNLHQQEA